MQMSKLVEITIEIDDDLYEQVKNICYKNGTTIEEVTIQFIKFCANPKNMPVLKKWVEDARKNGDI